MLETGRHCTQSMCCAGHPNTARIHRHTGCGLLCWASCCSAGQSHLKNGPSRPCTGKWLHTISGRSPNSGPTPVPHLNWSKHSGPSQGSQKRTPFLCEMGHCEKPWPPPSPLKLTCRGAQKMLQAGGGGGGSVNVPVGSPGVHTGLVFQEEIVHIACLQGSGHHW